MKPIYFACAITAGREYADRYQTIIDAIKAGGGAVLSELFADQSIDPGKGTAQASTPHGIWKTDLSWIKQASGIIAEVSQPSFGVGYEIAKAHEWNIPVLALYNPQPGKKLSSMIVGSPNVTVFEYQRIDEVSSEIARFIQSL